MFIICYVSEPPYRARLEELDLHSYILLTANAGNYVYSDAPYYISGFIINTRCPIQPMTTNVLSRVLEGTVRLGDLIIFMLPALITFTIHPQLSWPNYAAWLEQRFFLTR